MTRSFPLVLLLATGCNTLSGGKPTTPTTGTESSSGGYSWGEADDGSSEEPAAGTGTDTDTTGDDTGSGTDSGDDTGSGTDSGTSAESGEVTAKIWILPAATWDASVTAYDSYPEVCLYDVANVTDGDWEEVEYSVNCAATTEQNEWIYATKTFTPGDVLSVNADWWNGQIDVYFAGANGVVESGATYLIVQFVDGSYDGYYIEGSVDEAGEAGWVENDDGTGGNVYIYTWDHETGDYTD